ncbi:MAG: hypothetical protein KGL91_02245 [Xanthomonadaceae bacterium]|nr:hypothetical protein [Xanthomonadaceae bacterium]
MSRQRVVVLARAGIARDRTEAVVREAGADLALALDPATANADDLLAAAPDAVLVVLDPVVEAALDGFDAVLADPALSVLFDDAEVAAKREGWEAARWARHLAAKLQGHGDVLPAAPEAAPGLAKEMEALARQVAALSALTPASAPTPDQAVGALVISAGVGGPDAVRQLLGSLPAGFPRIILLRQRVDGGQYDKLVRQMQRAAQITVQLGQPGDVLQSGHVYVLPDRVDVQQSPQGLELTACEGDARFASLRSADSALLLLSGADTGLVDTALALRLGGALVYGQSPDNCFDPATSKLLVARGGEARSLAEMSRLLLQRWPV